MLDDKLENRPPKDTCAGRTSLPNPAALNAVNTLCTHRRSLPVAMGTPLEQCLDSDATASKAGLSAVRLARMHDTLLRHVQRGRLPGLAAVIGRRGAEPVDAIGTLAFERKAPMRRAT